MLIYSFNGQNENEGAGKNMSYQVEKKKWKKRNMEEGSTSKRHTLVKKDTKKKKRRKKRRITKPATALGLGVQCQWQQQTANEKENKCTNDVVLFCFCNSTK